MNAWPRVGVVGGSLGGLTAALVLRDLGCEVDVWERSTAELESRGAGIVVLDETLRYLRERTSIHDDDVTIATSTLRYLDVDGSILHERPQPYRYSGWHTIYRALLGRFDQAHHHLGAESSGFHAEGDAVRVAFRAEASARVDLLVCADGIGSAARRRLLPGVVPAYAGYAAWRGTVAEERMDRATLAALADAVVYQVIPASHILVYPIPNVDGATEPGRRLLNFVWYRNYPGPDLEDLMTDREGVRRDTTLPPGTVDPVHVAEMRAFATSHLAPPLVAVVLGADEPFVQAVFDIEVPRMAFGRACLIGDAAFALRPHIAAGTAKAASDGWALADALKGARGDVPAALQTWEARQLAVGRAALERSRRNGDRSQSLGTWRPQDPDLNFGLLGPLP
ncbi:MAG: FAD binding domain-containing protein [Actinomycetota bacterium]